MQQLFLERMIFLVVLALCTLSAGCDNDLPTSTETAKDPLPIGKASDHTTAANRKVLEELPFDNVEDFERSRRGFIAGLETPIIKDETGGVVYNLEQYDFLQGEAPDTVNPSLWRQSQLLVIHGLFKVTDRIYQVRNYDLANMTLVQGDKGWIVIDPLTSDETAGAALALANRELGSRPVVAVIYTHSHVDHFAGVKGVIDPRRWSEGQVEIIGPEGFMEEAVSENVLLQTAMGRRSGYMFGNVLTPGPAGMVGSGLGVTTATGNLSLLAPTTTITETGKKLTVDGVEIVFQNTPGAEAPAEMMFYFPQFKALCLSENMNGSMHNLYTLRGAKVRDALAWSKYIHKAIDLFGTEVDVAFGSHHWPRWGQDEVLDYMKKQRDLYKYLHDQTIRLANHGYTPLEIAEMIALPESLSQSFFNRGYYGSVNHNVKAVYQRYLGWFDGNPANLNALPPVESAKRYVDFMGGSEAVLAKARASFADGDYRWVVQVVNNVVFAEPDNIAARKLQAAALEQLGFQAESGPWRNFYLAAATELRNGVVASRMPDNTAEDFASALTLDMFFDAMAVRLNGPDAEGENLVINFDFMDVGEQYTVTVQNSVLNYRKGVQDKDADASISLKKSDLVAMSIGNANPGKLILSGDLKVGGNPLKLIKLFSLQDKFDSWFNIVTP